MPFTSDATIAGVVTASTAANDEVVFATGDIWR